MEALYNHWRGGADEEIEIASILLEKHKVRQALFFLHLALEKAVKSLVVRKTQDHPPKIHNLTRLAELAGLNMTDERVLELARYNEFCTVGRYADLPERKIDRAEAETVFRTGKALLQWLLSI